MAARLTNAELFTTVTATRTLGYDTNAGDASVTTYECTSTGRARSFAHRTSDVLVAVCDRCQGSGWHASELYEHECLKCRGTGVTGRARTAADTVRLVRGWVLSQRRRAAERQAAAEAAAETQRALYAESAALVAWAQELIPTEIDVNYYRYTDWFDSRAAFDASGAPYGTSRVASIQEDPEGRLAVVFTADQEWFGFGERADDIIRCIREEGYVKPRQFTYLRKVRASAIAKQEQRELAGPGRHAAAPGQRTTITGTVTVAKEIDGRYGASVFLVIEGTGEHTGITWTTFSTARGVFALDRGDTVTVTGTVKSHEERDGIAQDRVTRISLS